MKKEITNWRNWVLGCLAFIGFMAMMAMPDEELPLGGWVAMMAATKLAGLAFLWATVRLFEWWDRRGETGLLEMSREEEER
ncbi:MAG: hypothetical protein LUD72_11650 [Bacteroidales bacterium]|nr:hypothetical protein [Bacteroidales bacterium]